LYAKEISKHNKSMTRHGRRNFFDLMAQEL